MSGTALSAAWTQYGSVLRTHAHQLLLWGHRDARNHSAANRRIHADLTEPEITGLMAEAMNERLDHPDTPEEYNHYTVGDQVPVSRNGELGIARGRLDLSVIRSGVKPRISYIFEAKRLRTKEYTIGKYVGSGGMGDFIESRYARECPEAAMVGLFHDRDVTYWQRELRRSFQEDEAKIVKQLGILSHPTKIEILPDLTGELETTHRRTNQTPIRMLHIFLECA